MTPKRPLSRCRQMFCASITGSRCTIESLHWHLAQRFRSSLERIACFWRKRGLFDARVLFIHLQMHSEGHPDKVCDRISDEIVDLFREGLRRPGMRFLRLSARPAKRLPPPTRSWRETRSPRHQRTSFVYSSVDQAVHRQKP